MSKSVAVLLDASQALFALKHFNRRLDFQSLMTTLCNSRKTVYVGYFSTRTVPSPLEEFLRQDLGADVHVSANHTTAMSAAARQYAAQGVAIVIVSGNFRLAEMVHELRDQGCAVEVWAWPSSVAAVLQQASGRVMSLDETFVFPSRQASLASSAQRFLPAVGLQPSNQLVPEGTVCSRVIAKENARQPLWLRIMTFLNQPIRFKTRTANMYMSIWLVVLSTMLLTACTGPADALRANPQVLILSVPPRDYQVTDPGDPGQLAMFGLRLSGSPQAVSYFERAAQQADSRQLHIAALTAACLEAFRQGDRAQFLRIELILEQTFTADELENPPAPAHIVIVLARMARGSPLPSTIPERLARLVRDMQAVRNEKGGKP